MDRSSVGGSTATTVNGWADYIMDGFAELGSLVEQGEEAIGGWCSIGQTTASSATGGAQVQVGLNDQYLKDVVERNRFSDLSEGFVDRHFAGPYKPGSWVKGLAAAGGVIDSVTGVLSLAKAVKHDRDAGDPSYKGTMRSICSSVAQISSATSAGMIVGTAVAGVASSAALPVIAGAGAAVAVGWGIGKLIDYFF